MNITQLWPIRVVAGGAAQWLAKIANGIAVPTVVTGGAVVPTVEGVQVSQAPILATVNTGLGTQVSTAASGNPAIPAAGTGLGVGASLAAILSAPKQGWRVVNTFTNLVQTTYATGATSTGTWATPANATGAPDGANATNASTLITNASGALTLTYAAQVGKTPLTISAVTLSLYYATVLGPFGTMTVTIDYSLNSGSTWTNLSTSAAAATYSTTPVVFDITSPVGQSWPNLTALQLRVTFTTAGNIINSIAFDATTLVVTASQVVPN